MTMEEIRELLQLFNESGVGELEVERGGNTVRISRARSTQEMMVAASPPAVAVVVANAVPARTPAPDVNQVVVKSPIVGTFFESPSPESAPFVKSGDHVHSGQVLCIIESMKLMNEIEAEVSGTVIQRLVENGKPVEYGQPLFSIRLG